MLMMVYLFHLYNSGSRRDIIKLMVYLSIYAIETHDLKNSKFFSTPSLTPTSFFSEDE